MPYLVAPEALDAIVDGEPAFRTQQLHSWLYETPVLDVDAMSNLPATIRRKIGDSLYPFDVAATRSADDGRTVKWLFRTADGASIEAVLMGYRTRTTLCISSQAGCAMGCTFCATGQFGFERHLEPGEIVAQLAYANAYLRSPDTPDLKGSPTRVSNVVFMGMGEPLANYARVRESLRRMIDVMHLGARSITVSTVGVLPGMLKLAEEPWQVNLALSLHAADDDLRSELVPLNKRYPIRDLVEACRNYRDVKGRRVSLEWTLMAGTNDSVDQAIKLARIARSIDAHINVINLNPTPLTEELPSDRISVRQFIGVLEEEGANATLRDTRGLDIDAACGQLRVQEASEVPLPTPTTLKTDSPASAIKTGEAMTRE